MKKIVNSIGTYPALLIGGALLLLGSGPSIAADAAADDAELQEVVVTGTRIAGFTSPTPVTIVGADAIEKQGSTNLGEVLYQMPQFRQTVSPNVSFTSVNNVGVSTADLRGLGANRTLVLVDGKRFISSTVQSTTSPPGAVDMNLIPTAVIERAEIVTGGASASYGSDAVAGVVNILLNSKLQGSRTQYQYGITRYGDDKENQFSYAFGTDLWGGRGHAVIAAEYVHNQGVPNCFVTSRSFCSNQNAIGTLTNATPGVNGLPASVSLPNPRIAVASPGGLINAGPLRGTEFNSQGEPVPFNYGFYLGAGITMSGGTTYPNGFTESLPMAAELRRYAVYSHNSLKITDAVNATLDLSFGDNAATEASVQPRWTATVAGANALTIRNDNAFLAPAMVTRMQQVNVTSFNMGLIGEQFGQTVATAERKVSRGTLGFDGKIVGSWTWNAYLEVARSRYGLNSPNAVNIANFNLATDAVKNANGQIVCRSTLTNPTNGCVPINPFGGAAPATGAVAYAFGTMWADTTLKQQVFAANVQGDLFKLPAGPLTLAVGAEYRKNEVSGTVDPVGDNSGWFGVTVSKANGSEHVSEGYAELAVPVLKGLPLVKSLTADTGFRYTNYSTSGGVNSWKFGLVYDANDWLRLRGTVSRDIRAPNLFELFLTRFSIGSQLRDPITNQSNQILQVQGGNPNLKPETARTVTGGIVIQAPSSSVLDGLRLSVDYYAIDLKNAISSVGAQNILNFCGNGNAAACALITRPTPTSFPTQIENGNVNLNRLLSRGNDIELAYRLALARVHDNLAGMLDLRIVASHASELTTVDGSGTAIDRAGVLSGANTAGGVPKSQSNMQLTYSLDKLSVGARVRYISSGIISPTSVGPKDAGYSPFLTNSVSVNDSPSAFYVDLNAQYNLSVGERLQLQLYGVMNNVADRAPPQHNQAPQFYDVFGRAFRTGVRARF